jgi:hypothetical protein
MLDLETHLAAELARITGMLADLMLLDNLCMHMRRRGAAGARSKD